MQKQENQFWSKWNDENTAELKKLWGMGLSAGVISLRMSGFSRNAIIGKVHRLGLPGRPNPIGKFRTKSGTAARRPVSRPKIDKIRSERVYITKDVLPAAPLPPEPPKPSKLFKLVDMESDQCRFIYGDPKSSDSGFCGCKTATGSSYCTYHAQICTNAMQPTKKTAVNETRARTYEKILMRAEEFSRLGAEEFIRV